MNLLDRLKQAEAAATPEPWWWMQHHDGEPWVLHTNDGFAGDSDADRTLAELLRNHAAEIIRLVESADNVAENLGILEPVNDSYGVVSLSRIGEPGRLLRIALAPFLAEEDAR